MIIYIRRDWPGKAAAAANKIPSERFREKKKKIIIIKRLRSPKWNQILDIYCIQWTSI